MPRLFFVLVLLCWSIPGFTQPSAEPISEFLNRSLENLAIHTQDFNDHVSEVNAVRPLEPTNMDSAHMESTLSSVLEFTQYLRGYLRTTDALRSALTDSLQLLRLNDRNPDVQRTLDRFEASYKTDQTAWHAYVEALQEVYDNVLNALLFVKATKYDVHNGEVRFEKAADVRRYGEYMSKINRLTAALQRARTVSQKATEAANKQILALNKIHSQPSNARTRTRK